MVLEVLTDSRQIDDYRHVMLGEQPGRPQPRDLHQMRRPDRTRGQDDLPAGSNVDELAVFNRPLSDDEIKVLFQLGLRGQTLAKPGRGRSRR